MKRGEDQHLPRDDLVLRDPRVAQGLLVLQDLSLTSGLSWDKLNSKPERKDRHLTPSHTCKLRLDLLGLVDLQVSEDPRALRGSWDHKETPETRDHQDHLACRASLVCQDSPGKKERLELTGRQDLQVPLANLVREDCQECLVFQAPRDTEGSLDWTEPKVTLVHPERRARMDPLVQWEQLDLLDRQGLEESVVGMGPLE